MSSIINGVHKCSMFNVILASTHRGGIGKNNTLPWTIPEDLKYFSFITRSVIESSKINAVIMGRRTFESLPDKFRPLPNRLNIVISTTLQQKQQLNHLSNNLDTRTEIIVSSFDKAIDLVSSSPWTQKIEKVFVIGGKSVYLEALSSSLLQSIYLTRVQGPSIDDHCDVFLPIPFIDESIFIPLSISKTRSIKDWTYDFVRYERKSLIDLESNEISRSHVLTRNRLEKVENEIQQVKIFIESLNNNTRNGLENQHLTACPTVIDRDHEEFQYLDCIADIVSNGFKQDDRTGVGTLSKFGITMRFNLSYSFPLLTTKSVFWKGVVEELLWFIRGETNSNILSDKGVKIWDANGSRQFLDSNGFKNRKTGDLGPVYGFQWRHFGARYTETDADYSGQGVDQLRRCIETLKSNPTDRRILMSAWNPVDLDQMALPPCHLFCQFFVDNNSKLSCIMYQRSCDMGLGVPFNIASYSLLTRMVAQVSGLQPGEFIHVLGNAHVYLTHIEPLKKQLQRCPRPFPLLRIDPTVKDIDDFNASHFELIGYSPLPKIPMEMAV